MNPSVESDVQSEESLCFSHRILEINDIINSCWGYWAFIMLGKPKKLLLFLLPARAVLRHRKGNTGMFVTVVTWRFAFLSHFWRCSRPGWNLEQLWTCWCIRNSSFSSRAAEWSVIIWLSWFRSSPVSKLWLGQNVLSFLCRSLPTHGLISFLDRE